MKPKYAEIWLVAFEPQVGSEILKTRPALIININELSEYPLRIVMPIREYKEHHKEAFHYITLEPLDSNGLSKKSTIDCLQIKSFDISRFKKKLGKISEKEMKQALNALLICVGYQP